MFGGGQNVNFQYLFHVFFFKNYFRINLLHYICFQRHEKQRPEPCKTINIRQAYRATSCTPT